MTGLKFVLLSIEFDAGTFSGNGVYACSQVCAVAGAHDARRQTS